MPNAPSNAASASWRFLHVSNAVTYISLCAGLLAVQAAGPAGDAVARHAVGFWFAVSALADLLDGRFARRFERGAEQAAFGGQLDSLCDAIVFGAAPPLALAISVGGVGVKAAGAFHAVCAITRLGHYNLAAAESDGFIGLPTTLAGLAWSLLYFLPLSQTVALAGLALLGVAMVSPVRIRRPRGIALAIVGAVMLGAIALHAWFATRG
jgi:CDP-diacylglycerol--serine O-phosphatidyltransferase